MIYRDINYSGLIEMKYFKKVFSMTPTKLWSIPPTNIFTYKDHAKVINL